MHTVSEKRRDKNMITLDFADAGDHLFEATGFRMGRLPVLISLHKARYEADWMPEALRHESAKWLRDRGYGRIRGDLLPPGQLP